MRVHVALSPSESADAPVSGRTVLAVDVLRATSAAVAACEAGCRRVGPGPGEAAPEAPRGGAGGGAAGGGRRPPHSRPPPRHPPPPSPPGPRPGTPPGPPPP